jgi:hypothetical protein
MESTGIYGIPLFELLESRHLEVFLVDPRQSRPAPSSPGCTQTDNRVRNGRQPGRPKIADGLRELLLRHPTLVAAAPVPNYNTPALLAHIA